MTGLWYEITARVSPDLVDAISALMRDVSPGGVVIDEPIDILGPEKGFHVREDEPVSVRAYVPSSELGAVLISDLRAAMEAFPSVELVAKPIYEQDWSVSWREFFGVVETGGRVVIVPSWIEHAAAPGQVIIRLDPGRAFGTGHHETTRMCLASLDRLLRPGDAVLDVGTGTGILSIAAVLLGAGPVTALDIDRIAVEVAGANFAENGVAGKIVASTGVLTPAHAGRYDLVVSNITTEANIGLAAAFATVLRSGGRLILSGILGVDTERVQEAMFDAGIAADAAFHERDWCVLEFTR